VKRRQFITLLGGAAAWPFAAGAQQPVGILSPISATGARPLIAAFRSVLRDLGYLEGQNVTIAIRYGEGAPERMVPLAGEMIALNPDVIVAGAFVAIHKGDADDSNCCLDTGRSGRRRNRRQPCKAWGKYHRNMVPRRRSSGR
jgi:hypothetical protein